MTYIIEGDPLITDELKAKNKLELDELKEKLSKITHSSAPVIRPLDTQDGLYLPPSNGNRARRPTRL